MPGISRPATDGARLNSATEVVLAFPLAAHYSLGTSMSSVLSKRAEARAATRVGLIAFSPGRRLPNMPERNIPTGGIGFRLAHELEGLLHGVRADGVIDGTETSRLRNWLDHNDCYASVQPFSELREHLSRVLADGVITVDECDDLLFVLEKLTTVNPYFDALRAGLQVLMGMLTGVSADGDIGPSEARALSDWIEDWSHLRGLWPFEELNAIVTTMLSRGNVAQYRDHLFDLARQFPVGGDSSLPADAPLLVRGVCSVDPSIAFDGKTFVFTGESAKCDRTQLMQLVQERGGRPWKRVTSDVDYLVVCDAGSQFWAFSCYGRKVEQAYLMRRKGHRVLIVHEVDFWDAVAGTGAAV